MSEINPENTSPLPRKLMILYGLPHFTHAIVALPLALFVPSFYADELALPMAGVGLAIAASRLLDIISDPIVGVLSDRIHTRWGKRKPWLAAGTPLLILCAWMVLVPSNSASVWYLFVWASLLYLAYTFVDLPYKAWGAELSDDYSERSRITAWREAFGFSGQMLFLAVLVVMTIYGVKDVRSQLLAIALLIVITQPFLVAVTLWQVPEQRQALAVREHVEESIASGMRRTVVALRQLVKNRAFMRTLAAIVLFGTAILMQATLHRFVLNHVVKAPDLFAPMIMAENFLAIVCLPLWIWISDRISKHRAVCLAAAWLAFWSLWLPFTGAGDQVFYVILILLRGSSLAAIFFLSSSIGADVVDFDTVASGKQRTGLYFSLWGVATKFAIGLGVLLGTSLPPVFGFDPALKVNNADSIASLLTIYGWVPAVIVLLGIPFLWNFPIDKNKQQQLRQQIQAGVSAEDLTEIAK